MNAFATILAVVLVVLLAMALQDMFQKKHSVRRTWPLLGRLRYLFEMIGPELRQYIVTKNDEERPISRDKRRWIYAKSKGENELFGFGSDNDLEGRPNHLIILHSAFPWRPGSRGDPLYSIPALKKLGGWRKRNLAFYPESAVWISAMSFGALSGPAVEALNRGAEMARCLHNTGEGGISPYHKCGGKLIWQIGTGYFGCRDAHGMFNLEMFRNTLAENRERIMAIEVKLSQGAKPNKGGILPAAKVTPEIAAIRGVEPWRDCISPAYHTAFSDVRELIEFIEMLANESGLPVGIKSAVGVMDFWEALAAEMERQDRGPDFITVDGGEGGTGAAPLVFTDHVSLPWKIAFSRVYSMFAKHGLHDKVFFVGSGLLGFPDAALLAFALGCDGVAVAREAMLSVGCIQAQRCHTGNCPTGVATQRWWLKRGLDPTLKSHRAANYIVGFRHDLLTLCHACGVPHPSLITPDKLEIINDHFGSRTVRDVFGYDPAWRKELPPEQLVQIGRIIEDGNLQQQHMELRS